MKKIAIIQEAPCVLDKINTIKKAVEIINSVSDQGAELIVFPEAFIPGYPAWIWRLRPGGDWGICEELHIRLLKMRLTYHRMISSQCSKQLKKKVLQ